ncbi:VOC family protein [Motiliproteus sediminis]|uniref:VOC family protein n=1 Tax=Motiliproteus sediminis TaxID=1468178 RepID=UPI001AEF459E|nr:VOC family protein [Motiliproteus sediminis]
MGELSYVTLGVADLARSVGFYRDGLGLNLVRANEQLAFFDLGGVRLALYPALAQETGAAAPEPRAGHNSLSLNLPSKGAVDQLLAQALRAGAKSLRSPAAPPWGGYRGYLRDPDGFIWELVWHPDYVRRPTNSKE